MSVYERKEFMKIRDYKINETSQDVQCLFEPLDFFMLRAPLLPFNLYEELFSSFNIIEKPSDLLRGLEEYGANDLFREAISVASPSLIQSIDHYENKNEDKKGQLLKSLLRYLIRISSRSTPYGLFAGVAYGKYADQTNITIKEIDNHQKRTRPDMQWIQHLVRKIETDLNILKKLNVKFNSTAYVLGRTLKLPFSTGYSHLSNSNRFSIKYIEILQLINEEAKNAISFKDLTDKISNQYKQTSRNEIENYLHELVKVEILISEVRPPIMSSNPLEHIINVLNKVDGIEKIKTDLGEIKEKISLYDCIAIGEGEKAYRSLSRKMKELIDVEYPIQIDTLLGSESVQLPYCVGKEVAEVAELLYKLSPVNCRFPHLDIYMKEFISKYGRNRQIPITELLDEDMGLGPPLTYRFSNRKSYLNTDAITTRSQEKDNLLLQWIIEVIQSGKSEIELTTSKIKQLHSFSSYDHQVPRSLELYFKLTAPSIEELNQGHFNLRFGANFGSEGVGRTFGRFTDLMGEDLKNRLETAYRMEENLYPDAIFAEVAVISPVERSSNVTALENLRLYEIPLGTSSSKSADYTIDVNDLLVGLNDNNFYLWSKSLNKQVIPTKGHMLNYKDLPNIYRFLCEIGSVEERGWSPFDWGHLSNGPYLPRIKYKNTILYPAQWKLSMSILNLDEGFSKKQWTEAFSLWRKQYHVPRYIYLGKTSTQLLLDLECSIHLREIYQEFQKNSKESSLTIVEADDIKPTEFFLEREGKRFCSELVFPIIRRTDIITPKKMLSVQPNIPTTKRRFLPGSEWISFKIYAPPGDQEEIISRDMYHFLKYVKEEKLIDKGYFLRYSDPLDHIRLRFHGNPPDLVTKLWPEIYNWITGLHNKNLINNMTIDTYEPEIERYGGIQLITKVEDWFAVDSIVSTQWLNLKQTNQIELDKELLAVISIVDLMSCFFPSYKGQLKWLDSIIHYKEYIKEFRRDRNLYINWVRPSKNWEELRMSETGNLLYNTLSFRRSTFIEYMSSIQKAEKNSELTASPISIFESLIHMHLNRIFGTNRMKERKVLAFTRHIVKHLIAMEEIRGKLR